MTQKEKPKANQGKIEKEEDKEYITFLRTYIRGGLPSDYAHMGSLITRPYCPLRDIILLHYNTDRRELHEQTCYTCSTFKQ